MRKKHKKECNLSWNREFPWHVPLYTEDGSLLCSICQCHGLKQRNRVGTSTEKPCTYLRKDMLQRHKCSAMHQDAEAHKADRLASKCNGGIAQAFSSRVISNRKAFIGALKIMCWLAKEEVPHIIKCSSLMDLAVDLGSDYHRNLNLGKNAHYMSEQSIRELIQCLSSEIEEQILENIRSSDYFALMTDELTDLAVLKQPVFVARYMTNEGVKTSYLLIQDIHYGRAETIEARVWRKKSWI